PPGASPAPAPIIPAVAEAAVNAIKVVLTTACSAQGSPFLGKEPADLVMSSGHVHLKGQSPSSGVPFQEILKLGNLASANGEGKTGGYNFSSPAFGAQFVEGEWDPGICRLRVNRVVSVVDAGRIINARTARNQMAGAIVLGIGMGLLEATSYDPRNGHPINDNFADYVVPTSPDLPEIDVTFLDIPDPMIGEYGARGIGEIGLAGV